MNERLRLAKVWEKNLRTRWCNKSYWVNHQTGPAKRGKAATASVKELGNELATAKL